MYYVEKTKGTDYLKQFDYMLFFSVILMSMFGVVALRSALGVQGVSNVWLKQIICLCIGIVAAIVISAIDYKDFRTLGIVLYLGSIVLLVLVLLIGERHYGSQSWLKVPVIGEFQPSELSKVAFAVVVPIFFERLKEGKDIGKNVIKLLIYAMLPIVLVLMQPDVGTAMVFVFAFIVLLFIYGIPYRFFLIAAGLFLAAAPVLWFYVLPMKKFDHIRNRIISFIFPESDLLGSGLQVYRSKMTIGSGQLFGKGIFHGLQGQSSSMYYVPEQETDFIFTVIGEEMGFIGSVIFILIVFFFLFRCVYVSMNARDPYGSFMVICITAMFAFHFIENIGMCVGVLPVTGIPLPFVSQGNSSLIANYLNVGILLSVSMRRKRSFYRSSS
ncbi:MAG: FtsW/RodA/SpoVE family cell cycle protein [Acetivibrionales bacterium]|jgi:rod shape determining protein RodA|nr:FtsW/RodA/SpoVE family cell cycle protein [Bacillota bacterium]NLP08608.1 rod shape-determining protein RodA [Clostridiaceae bacterium]HOA54658.1 FtsW/RodA/SpoVE family cell cycle protein [Clostridiales bacterium]HQD30355.1 FtsW/RodA/SpoVE family cell cycle protein [Clostridiales bacterium]